MLVTRELLNLEEGLLLLVGDILAPLLLRSSTLCVGKDEHEKVSNFLTELVGALTLDLVLRPHARADVHHKLVEELQEVGLAERFVTFRVRV